MFVHIESPFRFNLTAKASSPAQKGAAPDELVIIAICPITRSDSPP
jgi:hypothetical protein